MSLATGNGGSAEALSKPSRNAVADDARLTVEEQRLRSLAPGELRVLAEVAQGRTDKEAAAVLNLSVKTVRNCLDRVFAKLNVHTRTEAALIYAASRGR